MAGRAQHGGMAQAKAQGTAAALPAWDAGPGRPAGPGQPVAQTLDAANGALPIKRAGHSLPRDAQDNFCDPRQEYAAASSGDRGAGAAGPSMQWQSSDDSRVQSAAAARHVMAAPGPMASTSASSMTNRILQRPQPSEGPPPKLSSTMCSPSSGSTREAPMDKAGQFQPSERTRLSSKDSKVPSDMPGQRFEAERKRKTEQQMRVIHADLRRAEEQAFAIRHARQERPMSSAERWLNGDW